MRYLNIFTPSRYLPFSRCAVESPTSSLSTWSSTSMTMSSPCMSPNPSARLAWHFTDCSLQRYLLCYARRLQQWCQRCRQCLGYQCLQPKHQLSRRHALRLSVRTPRCPYCRSQNRRYNQEWNHPKLRLQQQCWRPDARLYLCPCRRFFLGHVVHATLSSRLFHLLPHLSCRWRRRRDRRCRPSGMQPLRAVFEALQMLTLKI